MAGRNQGSRVEGDKDPVASSMMYDDIVNGLSEGAQALLKLLSVAKADGVPMYVLEGVDRIEALLLVDSQIVRLVPGGMKQGKLTDADRRMVERVPLPADPVAGPSSSSSASSSSSSSSSSPSSFVAILDQVPSIAVGSGEGHLSASRR